MHCQHVTQLRGPLQLVYERKFIEQFGQRKQAMYRSIIAKEIKVFRTLLLNRCAMNEFYDRRRVNGMRGYLVALIVMRIAHVYAVRIRQ